VFTVKKKRLVGGNDIAPPEALSLLKVKMWPLLCDGGSVQGEKKKTSRLQNVVTTLLRLQRQ
jgi:hypothetical protein